jgi:predicted Zn finger-like uncharacterized protein
MDVVCDRCNTEYEFDDALVSERGTTVKCTHCGHQFRIFRPKSDGTVARPWILKRSDGKTATFDSLAVLQRWIGEGKASRADLLSRDGVDWKPLGSIAELEGFFTQAEAKTRATASSKPGATTPLLGTTPQASAPPAAPPRRATTPGMPPAPPPAAPPPRPSGGSSAPYGAHAAPPPPSVPSLPAPPLPPPPPANAAASSPPAVTRRPTPPSAPVASEKPKSNYSMGGSESELTTEAYDFGDDTGIMEKWGADGKPKPVKPAVGPPPSARTAPAASAVEEEPPPRPSRSSPKSSGGKGALIGGVLVAIVAGGAIAAWQAGVFSSSGRTAATTDAVSSAIESAENSAKAATRAGFDDAKESLTALLLSTANRNDPRVLASRAAVLAARGESMRQRAEDLEARAARGGSDSATVRAEASIIRAGALADIERARTDAAAAEAGASRVTSADRGRFERALAEIARVVRADLASARQHATAAKSAGANMDLIDGLIARDAGEFDVAVAALRRAAEAPDADSRARLALARLYASRGDRAGAVEQLTALLRVRPQHDDAQAMSTAIEAGLPPLRDAAAQGASDAGAAAVVVAQNPVPAAVPDAGVAAGDPAVVTNGGTAPGTPSGGSAPSGAFAGRSYDWLVEEGERQRNRGQTERARSAFMAALGLRGDGCEAVTGLGYVEMRSGETGAAVLLFRRAIGLNSRYSDAHIGLGQAYERQGNTEQALRAYRQYLEINPGGSHAREAQSRIEALDRRPSENTGSTGSTGSTGASGSTGSTGSSGSTGSTEGSGSSGSGGGSTGASGSGSSGSSPAPSEGSGSAGTSPTPTP